MDQTQCEINQLDADIATLEKKRADLEQFEIFKLLAPSTKVRVI